MLWGISFSLGTSDALLPVLALGVNANRFKFCLESSFETVKQARVMLIFRISRLSVECHFSFLSSKRQHHKPFSSLYTRRKNYIIVCNPAKYMYLQRQKVRIIVNDWYNEAFESSLDQHFAIRNPFFTIPSTIQDYDQQRRISKNTFLIEYEMTKLWYLPGPIISSL